MALTHGFQFLNYTVEGVSPGACSLKAKSSWHHWAALPAATHPGNAVVLRVLLLQAVLLQSFGHRKARRVRGGQQDRLVGDIWS